MPPEPPEPPVFVTIAILAGGASRRMGRDKASLVLDGRTLLQRTVDTALAVSPRVVVVGRAGGAAGSHDDPAVGVLLENGDRRHFLADEKPGQGPLGGLVTALRRAQAPVLLLACDMPLLTAEALRWLLAAEVGTGGTVARWQDRLEPLFALYRPACLPLAEAQLAAGERAMHRFIAGGAFVIAEAPAWVGAQLVNVNTPGDWERFSHPCPSPIVDVGESAFQREEILP